LGWVGLGWAGWAQAVTGAQRQARACTQQYGRAGAGRCLAAHLQLVQGQRLLQQGRPCVQRLLQVGVRGGHVLQVRLHLLGCRVAGRSHAVRLILQPHQRALRLPGSIREGGRGGR